MHNYQIFKKLLEVKTLTKTNQKPSNYLLLTAPLLIFDPIGRGKQVV